MNRAKDQTQVVEWERIACEVLSWFLALPAFIALHKVFPELEWPLSMDRVMIAVFVIFVLRIVVRYLKPIVYLAFFVVLMWLSFGSFRNRYGFENIYADYVAMVMVLVDKPQSQELKVLEDDKPLFPILNSKVSGTFESRILAAIDYENPDLRTFALSATLKHFRTEVREFQKYRTVIQSFAIFKEINSNWNYVHDPKGRDYFAKASETIHTLSGDCDDHSILMAACIKSIGGTTRLVRTRRHIYPELLIGDYNDLETVNYIIRYVLFSRESEGKKLNYHIHDNQVWLNLDYTDRFPGAPFLDNEALQVIMVD